MAKKFEITESIGDTVISDVTMSSKQLTVVSKLQNALIELEHRQEEFAEYLDELKQRNEQIEELKKNLYQMMVESGAKKIESDYLTMTAVNGSVVEGIDIKKIKATNPKLWAKLREEAPKDTTRSGYVLVKTKKK